ncbi:Protein kish-B [Trichinella papuae]|uniref:Protein kish-B n=1 Tax=Trichinella papuae TaxID=268474 RepID=A0A0V1N8Y0_9BILA|nr:Protein kish-B [Trichinella papuae]
MNVYSYDGAFVVILLAVCSCAYFRRIPRLKKWFFSDKSGIWGVCYKASVIGIRLHALVALLCIFSSLYFCSTMVQHKVKQKISLPANAKSKSDRHRQRKVKSKSGMKKGKWIIKPKNSKDLKHFKKEIAISKVINEENEELITALSSIRISEKAVLEVSHHRDLNTRWEVLLNMLTKNHYFTIKVDRS